MRFDTLDANEQLGFDADERVYLRRPKCCASRFRTVRLFDQQPDKVAALERYGIRSPSASRTSSPQMATTSAICAPRRPQRPFPLTARGADHTGRRGASLRAGTKIVGRRNHRPERQQRQPNQNT